MATPQPSFAKQQTRIRKETAYGVPPMAVDQRLNALRIVPTLVQETDLFAPSGGMLPTVATPIDQSATAEVAGRLNYTDIIYILGSLLGEPVTTTPPGATDAREHVWSWDGFATINPVSYTVHYGTATNYEEVSGLIFNGLSFTASRENVTEISSTAFGKAPISSGQVAWAPSPVAIPAKPTVSPLAFDVFLDTDWASLGTTQLLYCYEFEYGFGEQFGRTRPLNSALTSDGIAEMEDVEHTVRLMLGYDATAKAQIDRLKEGMPIFVRLQAQGAPDSIEPGQRHELRFDSVVLLTEVGPPESAQGGVLVRNLSGRIAHDETSGNGIEVLVRNTLPGIV